MIKDVRTGVERTDSKKVLDGDITEFLEAALAQKVAPGQDEDAHA
jgi:peptide chain release factor 2